ncbi:MAG: ferredoxin [Candidatus Methylacidiphilales bacterium]
MGSHDMASGLRKAGVHAAARHLFLCLGPECCPMREGERVWDHLKRRCKDLSVPVMRTRAGCFRVCEDGPLLLIYPEGTWYSRVTIPRLERILAQHVERGIPITEWAVATNGLGRCAALSHASTAAPRDFLSDLPRDSSAASAAPAASSPSEASSS